MCLKSVADFAVSSIDKEFFSNVCLVLDANILNISLYSLRVIYAVILFVAEIFKKYSQFLKFDERESSLRPIDFIRLKPF